MLTGRRRRLFGGLRRCAFDHRADGVRSIAQQQIVEVVTRPRWQCNCDLTTFGTQAPRSRPVALTYARLLAERNTVAAGKRAQAVLRPLLGDWAADGTSVNSPVSARARERRSKVVIIRGAGRSPMLWLRLFEHLLQLRDYLLALRTLWLLVFRYLLQHLLSEVETRQSLLVGVSRTTL